MNHDKSSHKHTDRLFWPVSGWLKNSHLVPFRQETLNKAKSTYAQHKHSDYDIDFWKFVYHEYAGEMISRFDLKGDELHDYLASGFIPTHETPWSLDQLRSQAIDEEKHFPRAPLIQRYQDDATYREKVKKLKPDYSLLDVERVWGREGHGDPELLELVGEEPHTAYVPWPASYLWHFIRVIVPEAEWPHVLNHKRLTDEESRSVRLSLVKLWPRYPLLKKYVSNLPFFNVMSLKWREVAPLSLMIMGYAAWPQARKELTDDQLRSLWCSDVLIRSYKLRNGSYPLKLKYAQLFQDLVADKKSVRKKGHKCNVNYYLSDTPAGVVMLHKDDRTQLERQYFSIKDFQSEKPLKWTKQCVVDQAKKLLKVATDKVKGGLKTNDKDSDDDDIVPESQQLTILNSHLNSIMKRMREMLHNMSYFLNVLYDHNQNFREFLSLYMGDIETLRYLYVTDTSGRQKPETKAQVADGWSQKKLQQHLSDWLSKEQNQLQRDRAVQAFENDARSLPRETVPLMANVKRYQTYMRKRWSKYRLPEVMAHPTKSLCESREASTLQRETGRMFLTPDGAQMFLSSSFGPSSAERGKIVDHSVGSGKTCLAVRIASEFARAGFEIVWATKTSLKQQVLKNHMAEICNLLVRGEFERLSWLKGEDVARRWLKKLPKQSSFKDALSFLKHMGMVWTNLSYRQLSNALEEKVRQKRVQKGGKSSGSGEPEPLNQIGRRWKREGMLTSIEATSYDPLRKKLIIIDEAHKLFTGELDRTELPNVQIIHDKLQASYMLSGDQSSRVLFLSATPTPGSVLPLLSMINMFHPEDVFPDMRTLDPNLTLETGLVEDLHEVKQYNRKLEAKVACEMFPEGLSVCPGYVAKHPDEVTQSDIDAYFDAKSVIGPTRVSRNDLKNSLDNFWRQAFALISYYNISADYSKFPRTEFATIIMPSATYFQERLIAKEVVGVKKGVHLGAVVRRIRQISAWAVFQSAKHPSREPTEQDQVILKDNAKHTFFEPTYEDLKKREALLVKDLELRQASEPDSKLQEGVAFFKSLVEETLREHAKVSAEFNAVLDQIEEQRSRAASRQTRTKLSQDKGVLRKRLNKLDKELADRRTQVEELNREIHFFETEKRGRIQHLEKRLKRLRKRLNRTPKSKLSRKTTQRERQLLYQQAEHESHDKDLEEDLKEDAEEAEQLAELEEDEGNEEVLASDEEEELAEEEAVAARISGQYYTQKTWHTSKRKVPSVKAFLNPKRHYFDDPQHFEAKQFLKDMPLYSPKASKFIEVVRATDQHDQRVNPEKQPRRRHRKIMVFCEDLHAIRAVAGALTAHGWTFGMKQQYVTWKKTFYSRETDKEVGKPIKSKAPQLTWLPDPEAGGSRADYRRFLVLTRSRIGGRGGATLNDYAVQLIGAKGKEATYNHRDNSRGKDYRLILIDRNFMEGIDLPSTYGHLFDPVLSESNVTQIVGRISRFCGNADLDFVAGTGWPQKIYRYGLKFHTVGLHLTGRQEEKLRSRLKEFQKQLQIPEVYLPGLIPKLTTNLFSPVELQIILNGNMEIQRLKRRTLDVYNAMLEQTSVGAFLYEPAMRNLAQSRKDLQELLLEEDETEREYRDEIFGEDQKREHRITYNLRSKYKDEQIRWEVSEGRIFPLLQEHVKRALKHTTWKYVEQWLEPDRLKRYFDRQVVPDLESAEFITFSRVLALQIMTEMFEERVKDIVSRRDAQKNRKLQASRSKVARESRRKEKEKTKFQKSRDRLQKRSRQAREAELAAIRKQLRNTNRSRGFNVKYLRQHPEKLEELWYSVSQAMPNVQRTDFDVVVANMLTKTNRASKTQRKKAPKAALKEWKKQLKLNVITLRKSAEARQQLIDATIEAYPELTQIILEVELHKLL